MVFTTGVRFTMRTLASTYALPGRSVYPTAQRIRERISNSPTHTVLLPSAFSSVLYWTGRAEVAR